MIFKKKLLVLAASGVLLAWPVAAQDLGDVDPVVDQDPTLENVDMGDGDMPDAGDETGDTGGIDDGVDVGDAGDGVDVPDVPDVVEPELPVAMTPPGLSMHGIDLSSVTEISLPPGLEQQGKIPPGHALQAIGFGGSHAGGPPMGGPGLGGGGGIDPASLAGVGGPGRGNAFGRNR